MTYIPALFALILAVLDWIAVDRKIKILEYVTKPATMLALLWWIGSTTGFGGPMLWFTIGVIFCLAGDIFLMLPRDMFIFGLVAFLIGQLSYVVGFNDQAPFINLWGIIIIIGLVIYIGWLYPRLVKGLVIRGKSALKIPVLIYSVAISLMVYSALMTLTRTGWQTPAALSVSIGALFFFTSDSLLAWDRFILPLPHARVRTMITYHLGVFGIVFGAILHVL